ncbi:MAG: hypothetical protein ACRYF3_06690 [Janthinobacterium lividum]
MTALPVELLVRAGHGLCDPTGVRLPSACATGHPGELAAREARAEALGS